MHCLMAPSIWMLSTADIQIYKTVLTFVQSHFFVLTGSSALCGTVKSIQSFIIIIIIIVVIIELRVLSTIVHITFWVRQLSRLA